MKDWNVHKSSTLQVCRRDQLRPEPVFHDHIGTISHKYTIFYLLTTTNTTLLLQIIIITKTTITAASRTYHGAKLSGAVCIRHLKYLRLAPHTFYLRMRAPSWTKNNDIRTHWLLLMWHKARHRPLH